MIRVLTSLATLAFATSAWGVAVNDKVENFRLFDHTGGSHELYYFDDQKAVVFMVQGNGCPIVRNAAPQFAKLAQQYEGQDVQFFMLNANLQDNRASVAAEASKHGWEMPILVDETQIIGESLDLVRTGEVFVVDPKTWDSHLHRRAG